MTKNLTSAAKRNDHDGGFTLIEMLIVIVVLGVLAATVTFAIRGMSRDAAASVCGTDKSTLSTAVELYMGQHSVTSIPGADAAARMDVLVDAGLITSASPSFVVEADGAITPVATCVA